MPLRFLRLQSDVTATTRGMRLLGGLAASIFAITIPFLYLGLSVYALEESLRIETAGLTKAVEQIIQARPDMWEFEQVRLLRIVSQPSIDEGLDERTIRTAAGTVVAKTDFSATSPAITVSAAFFDSGIPVGSIEARHSIRKQLFVTALLGMLSSSLGYLLFFIFRTYPIRRLENVLADLQRAEEEERRNREEAERLAAEMAVIADIGKLVGSTLAPDEVYERFAVEARKLISFDRLAVNLHSPHEENVRLAYTFGEAISGRSKGESFPLKGSISEILIKTRAGLFSHPKNVEEMDQRFPNHVATVQAGMRSLMGVPLIYRNEVIASLHFRSKTPNAYTERDLRLAERIGAQIAGAIGSARIFSDLRKTENAMRESEKRYRALVESASDIVFRTDETGHLTFVNPATLRITGYEEKEIIGMHYPTLIRPDMREEAIKFFGRQFVKGIPNTYSEYPVIVKDGREIWFGQNTQLIFQDGKVVAFQSVARDITDRRRIEEALKDSEKRYRELSIVDDLTQLYNSRHFYFQFKIELDRSNRYEQPLTLLLLDLDNFKTFNDAYGHVEGDQVLRRLGQVVKKCLRETDFAYRYGGEEFTILLPMTTSADGAVTAERIRTEFKKETFSPAPGQDVHVTVSIGLAQYKTQEEMKAFVHRVDQLMYQGKKGGKDRVCSES